MFTKALTGSRKYYLWIGFLGTLVLIGLIFYLRQFFLGLQVTGMGRDVSWGLYLANFTFLVGVAASAVMVVLPYYVHHYKQFRRLTTLGEFLSVAAIVMCIAFVVIDLGYPTRLLNLFLHPSPGSPLFWDILVLTGYMLLNITIGWLVLDARRKGESPKKWLMVIILISIPWAISIHTVTAFIYAGLAARGWWLTALLAARFLASAFAAGPALLIMACAVLKRFTSFDPGKEAIGKLVSIVTYALIVTVFFFILETFTILYSDIPSHVDHYLYAVTGLNGFNAVVPWFWTAAVFWIVALVLLLVPPMRRNPKAVLLAMALVFLAMWIDKGLVLMVPGFVPSPTGEMVQYYPTANEWLIMVGVWALGLLILTILYKIAISVMHDLGEDKPDPVEDFAVPHPELDAGKEEPSSASLNPEEAAVGASG